jgi:hypothetical protein
MKFAFTPLCDFKVDSCLICGCAFFNSSIVFLRASFFLSEKISSLIVLAFATWNIVIAVPIIDMTAPIHDNIVSMLSPFMVSNGSAGE